MNNSLEKISKKIAQTSLFMAGLGLVAIAPIAAQDDQNIVELAQSDDNLSTLVTAVDTAGLVDTLSSGDSSFTVFAPTNDAFNNLPDGVLDDLLQEENRDALTDVLTFHVVDGEAFAGDLSDGQVLTTLQGEELTVRIDGDTVFINDARVTTADLDANNGVVHVIDSVLVPSAVANSALLADTGIIGNDGQVAQYATLAGLFLIGSTFAVVGYKKLNQ